MAPDFSSRLTSRPQGYPDIGRLRIEYSDFPISRPVDAVHNPTIQSPLHWFTPGVQTQEAEERLAAEKAKQLQEAEKTKGKELAAPNSTDNRSGSAADVNTSGRIVLVCVSCEKLPNLLDFAVASHCSSVAL